MTPKQKYDERQRLKAERRLRQEQQADQAHQRQEDMEAQMIAMVNSLERIADVMELWADKQT